MAGNATRTSISEPAIATDRRPLTDLYEACARDDLNAITEFVRLYQPELASYARRHRADDAEGAADLATFDTVRRLADMRRLDEPAVRAYLYRSLKSRLADERRTTVPEVSLDDQPVELIQDGPEQPVLGRLGLTELLDVLTPAEREVVSHRFVAGYTSVETAERVGRSPDAVRRLQSNALARLRLALAVALLMVAVGTGYWLLRDGTGVRSTDPIDSPADLDPPAPDADQESWAPAPTVTPRPGGPPAARATGRVASSTPTTGITGRTVVNADAGDPEASATSSIPALAEPVAERTPRSTTVPASSRTTTTGTLTVVTSSPTIPPSSTMTSSTMTSSTMTSSTTTPSTTTPTTEDPDNGRRGRNRGSRPNGPATEGENPGRNGQPSGDGGPGRRGRPGTEH